jgi:P-type Cu+ transporter
MEKIHWKVEGMTCANCALTINKYLQKERQRNIKVNPIDGDVHFELVDGTETDRIRKGIEDLGYHVAGQAGQGTQARRRWLKNHLQRFLFTLPFTALLMLLHLIHTRLAPGLHFLMNPWVQLGLSLPVYYVGMDFFGRSALKSLRNGLPNMNVLIALGATAAFGYSLTGTLLDLGPDYMFYETSASIITLVFLGHYLEDASMTSTQRALRTLSASQKVMANMIAFDDKYEEQVFPIENTQLKVGDLVLIRSGEQVPIDSKVIWGEAEVDESIITGESVPVHRVKKDNLIGGSVVVSGTVRAQVTAVGKDTVLAGILDMVSRAQGAKPPVQLLADRIAAVFVPVVILISVITFGINLWLLGDAGTSLLRAIAVLVISCPCAMGLATPAAVAVGMGRAARNGILFRNAASLEKFKDIRQVVFDKTGTLTTGAFTISKVYAIDMPEETFKHAVWSLEKYSNHPIARSISEAFKSKQDIRWETIEEIRGVGMRGVDREGNEWIAGSWQQASGLTEDKSHNVYITRNGKLAGWIDLTDQIRPEAAEVMAWLKRRNIRTILLSGDAEPRCATLAESLGMDAWFSNQSPAQKMERIAAFTRETPTAMVGDGINDAPALAQATLGISLSDASHLALQQAEVVLMNQGLRQMPTALGLGRHTYATIRQNLFWAFIYNIVAIPIAAIGLLTPTLAAAAMGLSDVVLAANSIRLFVKKVV